AFASIPHDWYVFTSQSCAARTFGEPMSRGPRESNRVWARGSTWELSIPTDQMRRSTESSVGMDWAVNGRLDAAYRRAAARTNNDRRVMYRGRNEAGVAGRPWNRTGRRGSHGTLGLRTTSAGC